MPTIGQCYRREYLGGTTYLMIRRVWGFNQPVSAFALTLSGDGRAEVSAQRLLYASELGNVITTEAFTEAWNGMIETLTIAMTEVRQECSIPF